MNLFPANKLRFSQQIMVFRREIWAHPKFFENHFRPFELSKLWIPKLYILLTVLWKKFWAKSHSEKDIFTTFVSSLVKQPCGNGHFKFSNIFSVDLRTSRMDKRPPVKTYDHRIYLKSFSRMKKLFCVGFDFCIFQTFEAATVMAVMTCILQSWRHPAQAMWTKMPHELETFTMCD